MAPTETSNQSHRKGRILRSPIRVDLTPMVDLGFLLITFFVFTTSLASQQSMPLYLPADGPPTQIPMSGAVAIIPHQNGYWYYQHQLPSSKTGMHFFASSQLSQLRSTLLHLKQQLIANYGNDEKLMVVIKPTPAASFSQVINALDEMTICQVKRYALTQADAQELALLEPE